VQLLKNLPASNGTRRFITVFFVVLTAMNIQLMVLQHSVVIYVETIVSIFRVELIEMRM
jgi:hypothetical protein